MASAPDVSFAHVRHAPGENQMKVTVLGVRTSGGFLRVAVYRSSKGFPQDSEQAVARKAMPVQVQAKAFDFVFVGLPPGFYAVAVHHDENGNGRFDTHWLGMPREAWGVSRNAQGTFGPPSFEDARFEHHGTETLVRVRLNT